MNNRIDKSGIAAEKSGYGQLGVVCPLSLPPYTYSLEFIDMLYESNVDLFFIPFTVPQVRMPWMMGGTEQSTDVEGFKEGITPEMCFEIMRLARAKYPEKPIVAVSFYNDIFAYGIERFADKCQKIGIDGLDVPGYSLVENKDYSRYIEKTKAAGVYSIFPISMEIALAPCGSEENRVLVEMIKASGGFVFLMTDSGGKSGATSSFPVERMRKAVENIRRTQNEVGVVLPIITVCGVSAPSNCIEAIEAGTDGALLASSVIRLIKAGKSLEEIGRYLSEMKEGLRK